MGNGVLMNLPKAFDTINYDLLLAKLHVYGFTNTLRLIKSYLTNRWQRTKSNISFSSWSELLLGVPQGSLLGPLLFNFYLNDLFYLTECTNACNYADGLIFHACDSDLKDLITRLEHDSLLALEWFQANYMKLNEEKCHLLISGPKHELLWENIGRSKIWESEKQKLLGILIDWNLRFDEYILSQCKKAGRKLSVLVRIGKFMTVERRRMLMKAFIESQFGYCPLVWICCNRNCNNRINYLHERALKMVYNDNVSSFEDLLQRDQSVSIHHRNIRLLGKELYKTRNNISSHIMNELFEQRNIIYNHRSQTDFTTGPISTVNYGLKSLRYLGPKIWNIIPPDIRKSGNIEEFTRKIKCWTPKNCPCTLCLNHIHHVGYVN